MSEVNANRSDRETAGTVRCATAALALVLAALVPAACGPDEPDRPPAGEAPDTMSAAPAPEAGGPEDTTGPAEAPAGDTADEAPAEAPADTAPAAAAGTATAPAGTAASDTPAARRRAQGRYVVYVRRGESPDSVAADHGVEPDTVLADLPGFYARLTSDQATGLDRDERVRQLARQIEGRAPPEPRGIPTAEDTAPNG